MKENDVIRLRGIELYAYHGVMEEERILGQRFVIDVDIFLKKPVNMQDSLAETVNYAEVYQVVRHCVVDQRYQLIETLAEKIALEITNGFSCSGVRVEVHKPNAPVPGILKDISVEIIREKKDESILKFGEQ
ncbi:MULTISPECIES: dihydroneopterin aldolase [unclassified Dehalobacter]|uniref:dihydroneopterin aldolase n=1 Tax=unclassified Dehalobacter TaxID=2635733 RepID=UPI00037B22F5|nr:MULTISPECIES: dihydroneopterin aldolase [unclassified Dehalobacter]RJE47787.1 dihydroneopterin aldolase [Dehalobacter sp. MCB1]TCX49067.1 dihydroneopterin aldolase [Dehalobacter sp. 14DCB1]TCX56612.1 dihydroneopterin aldolase [Dehalobacter sp. 12DCB1]